MLIHARRKLVWLHNPKAAGTAVAEWLTNVYGFVPAVPDLTAPFDPGCPTGLIWRHAWDVPEEFRGFEVFCVVRHPIRRWESFFNYFRRYDQAASEMSLDEFTRARLDWLPTQASYLDRATSWIRLESLRDGLADHGLTVQLESIPVRNETGFLVRWTDEAYERVIDRFRVDFGRLGYRIPPGPKAGSPDRGAIVPAPLVADPGPVQSEAMPAE